MIRSTLRACPSCWPDTDRWCPFMMPLLLLVASNRLEAACLGKLIGAVLSRRAARINKAAVR